ncbi:hypothetical protein [Megamonas funiformis]|uniref:hypothetical protein n=1 Tax=Megamonas funiformis TaxID=437897 RepID=UPI003993FBAF
MTFNSLNTIIDDIFLILRDNNISESENLSRIQVEQWIHQYRAYLIKQDLDKGRDINPSYIQTLGPLHISKVSTCGVPNGFHYISDKELPKFIDLHFGTGLVSVKDMYGNLIQVGTETKARYQTSRKYTCNDYIAYVKDNHLYLNGPGDLEYVQIEGVLEDPTKAGDCFDYDDVYPVPANLIPVIKDMIFKRELDIMLKVPSDTTNNSTNDVKTN